MNNLLVSVIVPVYNVQQYLHRCLDSILAQTYDCLQVILVNDGSVDESGSICRWYQEKDPRVVVIDQENGGLSSARNAGLDVAKGEYVLFVDADDWLELDLIQMCIRRMERCEADIILYGYFEINEKGTYIIRGIDQQGERAISKEEAIDLLIKDGLVSSHVWDKIFRKKLFDNVRFPINRNYEDIYVMHRVFGFAERIYFLNTPKYYYFQRSDSICHVPSEKNLLDMLDAYKARYLDLETSLSNTQCRSLLMLLKKRLIFDSQYKIRHRERWKRYLWVRGETKKHGCQTDKLTEFACFLSAAFPVVLKWVYKIKGRNGLCYRALRYLFKKRRYRKEYRVSSPSLFLLGWPEYNNLGDHAIAIAEKEFLQKTFPNYDVVSIAENEILYNIGALKKTIKKDDVIFCQGGGNIGDEYPDQQKIRDLIFTEFKQNKIIIMPSTVYFAHSSEDEIRKKLRFIMDDRVHLFCRERYTYNFMKHYKRTHLYLSPDIVLFLSPKAAKQNPSKQVLFCIRSDKESSISFEDIANQKKKYIDMGYEIFDCDTCLSTNVRMDASEMAVSNMIAYIAGFDAIVTDRLHGVIFGYLAGTTVHPIDNYNYKIKGICEWINGAQSVHTLPGDTSPNLVLTESFDAMKEITRQVVGESYENND